MSGDVRLLRIVGGIKDVERFPELAECIGQFVVRYEPEEALHGRQWIWTTPDPDEAALLTVAEVHEMWSRSIGTRPWDGKPDRPITAFHVEMLKPLQKEEA